MKEDTFVLLGVKGLSITPGYADAHLSLIVIRVSFNLLLFKYSSCKQHIPYWVKFLRLDTQSHAIIIGAFANLLRNVCMYVIIVLK